MFPMVIFPLGVLVFLSVIFPMVIFLLGNISSITLLPVGNSISIP